MVGKSGLQVEESVVTHALKDLLELHGREALDLQAYDGLTVGQAPDVASLFLVRRLLRALLGAAPSAVINENLLVLSLSDAMGGVLGYTGPNALLKARQIAPRLRVALSHVRLLAQQPERFRARCKGVETEAVEGVRQLLLKYSADPPSVPPVPPSWTQSKPRPPNKAKAAEQTTDAETSASAGPPSAAAQAAAPDANLWERLELFQEEQELGMHPTRETSPSPRPRKQRRSSCADERSQPQQLEFRSPKPAGGTRPDASPKPQQASPDFSAFLDPDASPSKTGIVTLAQRREMQEIDVARRGRQLLPRALGLIMSFGLPAPRPAGIGAQGAAAQKTTTKKNNKKRKTKAGAKAKAKARQTNAAKAKTKAKAKAKAKPKAGARPRAPPRGKYFVMTYRDEQKLPRAYAVRLKDGGQLFQLHVPPSSDEFSQSARRMADEAVEQLNAHGASPTAVRLATKSEWAALLS